MSLQYHFFIPYFDILSYELHNFMSKVLYEPFHIICYMLYVAIATFSQFFVKNLKQFFWLFQ